MFVVFEGLDGSGKSTLMRAFKSYLKSQDQSYVEVFDPGGTSVGDKIREVLLTKEEKPSSRAELLMYQASRAELVSKVIEPALKEKKWVVSDRFYQSTLAFQGFGRGLDTDDIDWLNHFATNSCAPDVVVWVDTPVEVCAERLQKRKASGEELSRLDEEKRSFHTKVYEGYKSLSQTDQKSRWIVLNGLKSPDELSKELIQNFKSIALKDKS